jgi:membrane-bound lytic murein transglycosylase D
MRFKKLYLLIAPLMAWVFAGTACQTAHQATFMPPPQATAPAIAVVAAPAPAPPVEVEPTPPQAQPIPKVDPVADLITQVEKEYQAGQVNFKAGRLDAAKQNYDRALDLLAKSQLDVKSDPRLQREFDQLQTAEKSVQQQDAQQAQASEELPAEPAPIDEANDATPPVDANTKAKAEAEMKATRSDLPLMMTDQVAGYIDYFSGRGRESFENALVRSGRYQEMIQRTLKQEGVPQDLIYLAQAESGFHPLAVSRAGARGMWQFMSSRAKGYGLHRTRWVDERQDPEKATRAAAHHLKDLYNQFGDWYLAMAAYNSGPGGVQSAVKRTGYADFWELYRRNVLPRETRNYVPIILAVTIMTKNPKQYGLDQLVPDKPLSYDTVKIDYPVDLRLVAQCVDVTPYAVQELNPSLLRWTTPESGEFELRLPAGSKDQYLSAINAVPTDMRVWWRYHKVSEGDTLASLARAYRTTAETIARANDLNPDEDLAADSHLVIPIAPGKHAASEESQTYARAITRYRVRRGDTVQTVAENFNVPPSMVRRWNRLKGNSLRGRRVLYLHQPVSPTATEAMKSGSSRPKSKKTVQTSANISEVRYAVKPGETLFSIATTHHTTVEALQRYNGNLPVIKPGMVLIIRPN